MEAEASKRNASAILLITIHNRLRAPRSRALSNSRRPSTRNLLSTTEPVVMSLSLLRQLCQRTSTTAWGAPIQVTASRFSSFSAHKHPDKEWDEVLGQVKSLNHHTPAEKWKRNSDVFVHKPPRNAYSGETYSLCNHKHFSCTKCL